MKTERFFVSKEDIITVNENNLINLNRADGKVYERLEPRRLFPVSRQNSYITLLDDSGVEDDSTVSSPPQETQADIVKAKTLNSAIFFIIKNTTDFFIHYTSK